MTPPRPNLTLISTNHDIKPKPKSKAKYKFQSDLTAAQLATMEGLDVQLRAVGCDVPMLAQMRPIDAVGDPIEAPSKLKLVQPPGCDNSEEEFSS